jgi:hypothetical protein
MWVVYLEAGLAFVLAVLIVWWTWPKKNPPGKPGPGEPGKDDQ